MRKPSIRHGEWQNHEYRAYYRYLLFDNLFHKLSTEYVYIICSRSSIHIVLQDQLQLGKVSASGVPQQLIETHLDQHHTTALALLIEFNKAGDAFLGHIVTDDETWVHYWTLQLKPMLMSWKFTVIEMSQKFWEVLSVGKTTATIFWDTNRILTHWILTIGFDNHFCVTFQHSFTPITDH